MTLYDYTCGKSLFIIHTIVICTPDLRNNHSPTPDKTKMTAEPDKMKFLIKSADSSTILCSQELLGKKPDSYEC